MSYDPLEPTEPETSAIVTNSSGRVNLDAQRNVVGREKVISDNTIDGVRAIAAQAG